MIKLNKWRLSGLCLLATIAIFYLNKTEKGLRLPECHMGEVAETNIHFLIDYHLLATRSIDSIELRIEDDLQLANTILSNSCIPMIRQSSGYQFVDLQTSSPANFASAHYDMSQQFPKLMDRAWHSASDYVVLLMSEEHSYFDVTFSLGETWVDLFPNFVVLDVRASAETLEHELGHLAWAQHDMKTLTNQLEGRELSQMFSEQSADKKVPYGHGALCGGAGTVMSYADRLLPVYSSPDVYYNGQRCGDEQTANNTRLMRDYANQLLSRNTR